MSDDRRLVAVNALVQYCEQQITANISMQNEYNLDMLQLSNLHKVEMFMHAFEIGNNLDIFENIKADETLEPEVKKQELTGKINSEQEDCATTPLKYEDKKINQISEELNDFNTAIKDTKAYEEYKERYGDLNKKFKLSGKKEKDFKTHYNDLFDEMFEKSLDKGLDIENCFNCRKPTSGEVKLPAFEIAWELKQFLKNLRSLLKEIRASLDPTKITADLCKFIDIVEGTNALCISSYPLVAAAFPIIINRARAQLMELGFSWTGLVGPIISPILNGLTYVIETFKNMANPIFECILNAFRTMRISVEVLERVGTGIVDQGKLVKKTINSLTSVPNIQTIGNQVNIAEITKSRIRGIETKMQEDKKPEANKEPVEAPLPVPKEMEEARAVKETNPGQEVVVEPEPELPEEEVEPLPTRRAAPLEPESPTEYSEPIPFDPRNGPPRYLSESEESEDSSDDAKRRQRIEQLEKEYSDLEFSYNTGFLYDDPPTTYGDEDELERLARIRELKKAKEVDYLEIASQFIFLGKYADAIRAYEEFNRQSPNPPKTDSDIRNQFYYFYNYPQVLEIYKSRKGVGINKIKGEYAFFIREAERFLKTTQSNSAEVQKKFIKDLNVAVKKAKIRVEILKAENDEGTESNSFKKQSFPFLAQEIKIKDLSLGEALKKSKYTSEIALGGRIQSLPARLYGENISVPAAKAGGYVASGADPDLTRYNYFSSIFRNIEGGVLKAKLIVDEFFNKLIYTFKSFSRLIIEPLFTSAQLITEIKVALNMLRLIGLIINLIDKGFDICDSFDDKNTQKLINDLITDTFNDVEVEFDNQSSENTVAVVKSKSSDYQSRLVPNDCGEVLVKVNDKQANLDLLYDKIVNELG